jgi:hypothetical protein
MCICTVANAGFFGGLFEAFGGLIYFVLFPALGALALIAVQIKRRIFGQAYGWPFDPIAKRGEKPKRATRQLDLLRAHVAASIPTTTLPETEADERIVQPEEDVLDLLLRFETERAKTDV